MSGLNVFMVSCSDDMSVCHTYLTCEYAVFVYELSGRPLKGGWTEISFKAGFHMIAMSAMKKLSDPYAHHGRYSR